MESNTPILGRGISFKERFKKFCIYHWKTLGFIITLPLVVVMLILTNLLWQILHLESYGIILQPISFLFILGTIWKSHFLTIFRPQIDILIEKVEMAWGWDANRLKKRDGFKDGFNTPPIIIWFYNQDDYKDIIDTYVRWWLIDKEDDECVQSMLTPEKCSEPALNLAKHQRDAFCTFSRKFLFDSDYHLKVELYDKIGKIRTIRKLETEVEYKGLGRDKPRPKPVSYGKEYNVGKRNKIM